MLRSIRMNASWRFIAVESEWELLRRATVDESVTFIAETVRFIDFDAWVQRNDRRASSISRVDLVALPDEEPSPHWLVEVKDYRVLNHLPSEKTIRNMPAKLAAKIADSLGYLRSAELPEALRGLLPEGATCHFVFHCEMPREVPACFPSGYSVNVVQKLRQNAALRRLVARIYLSDAASLETQEDIPWTVELHDARVSEGA